MTAFILQCIPSCIYQYLNINLPIDMNEFDLFNPVSHKRPV